MILEESTKQALKALGGVTEFREIGIFEAREGIEFDFKNSLKANYAKIVEYNLPSGEIKYIIQLRKRANGDDKLVFEDIVKPSEIDEVFEKRTGISINYFKQLMGK